jgi:hypothetical protein
MGAASSMDGSAPRSLNTKGEHVTAIESLDEVRPGDFMIAGQNAAPAKVIVYFGQLLLGVQFRIGRFAAGHAAMVVPGGKLVEAMPNGARVRNILSSDWSDTHVFFRLPEDYPGQAEDAAAVALAMVGTPYSFMSYVYLAAYRFGFRSEWMKNRINRRYPATALHVPSGRLLILGRPVEAICSVLAEQAWTLTGKKVIVGTAPQVVTPGLLAAQLWERYGVIIGGAGLLH